MKIKMIKSLLVTVCFSFLSLCSYGAELVNASWSADNTTISAPATYTFSYQVVTASPTYAFYAIFPVGFNCSGVAATTVSVDGTPATLSGISYVSGAIVRLALTNPALVTAGSTVTVTVQITNASTAGSKAWTWIRTANGGGNAIDQISTPAPIVLIPPVPAIPVAISASSITTSGFKAYWNTVFYATSYRLDISTVSDFSSFLSGYNDLNVGAAFSATLTGLTPGTTYYYRVRATNATGTSNSSNVITAVTSKAAASVVLTNLSRVYDGSLQYATANTSPSGLTIDFTYDGSSTVPTTVGSYAVIGTVNDPMYQGTASGTLVISKGTTSISLGNLTVVYDGSSKAALASTTPAGLTVDLTYNGSATPPVNAGTYAVAATLNDNNYQGTASGTLVISKATPIISLTGLVSVYDGTPKTILANTNASGATVDITYNGSSVAPVNAGIYAVVASVNDSNYLGTVSGTLLVAKATAAISLTDLSANFDGSCKTVTAGTSPSALLVDITYDGSTAAPMATGTYAVVATINDSNYEGLASANLTIAKVTGTIGQTLQEVSIYPNPASDFVKVEAPGTIKNIQLVDLSGSAVAVIENYSSGEMIDVRSLDKGAYTVIVESTDGKGYYKIVLD